MAIEWSVPVTERLFNMSKAHTDPKQHSEEYRAQHAEEPAQKQEQQDQSAAEALSEAPSESPSEGGAKAAPPKRAPQDWDTLINRRIEEAMQRGDFDNLRGKGKPLNTTPEPHVPPDMQMANSLLKNNDLSPAWISDRAAVLGLIERFRDKLRAVAADFAQARAEARTPERGQELDELWGRYVETWRAEIVEINKRVLTQNLKQPVTFLEIVPLRLEHELKRANS